jgi:hypothetical protein
VMGADAWYSVCFLTISTFPLHFLASFCKICAPPSSSDSFSHFPAMFRFVLVASFLCFLRQYLRMLL